MPPPWGTEGLLGQGSFPMGRPPCLPMSLCPAVGGQRHSSTYRGCGKDWAEFGAVAVSPALLGQACWETLVSSCGWESLEEMRLECGWHCSTLCVMGWVTEFGACAGLGSESTHVCSLWV